MSGTEFVNLSCSAIMYIFVYKLGGVSHIKVITIMTLTFDV